MSTQDPRDVRRRPATQAADPRDAGALPRPRRPHPPVVLEDDDVVAEMEAVLEAATEGTDDDVDPSASPAAAVAGAWADYRRTGERGDRDRLILHYVPLVAAVARRVGTRLPSSVEHADLVSSGMFGLIEAIERYESSRAVSFEAYASPRIRGAMLDDLRATDWIPRSVRSKARAVDRAYAELEAELRRTPTHVELAARLEMGMGDLRSVLAQIRTLNVAALDELLGAERGSVSLGETLHDDRTPDPAGSFETRETTFLLARAMDRLREREKIVLVLYYYENLTLAEIGRVLGVTESRISQMHRAAMVRLRALLAASEHEGGPPPDDGAGGPGRSASGRAHRSGSSTTGPRSSSQRSGSR